MIIKLDDKTEIDTDTDLTSEERHVIQKLFGWREFADSIKQFRQKTTETLKDGWNNSGPVRKSEPLRRVIEHLEKEVQLRLNNKH